ncbi:alpha/beta hydrolase-fold protein [Roseibacillus persicicus]|nr:alpha/beta hydrolase-fold protein [Roseibacillus persicicus]
MKEPAPSNRSLGMVSRILYLFLLGSLALSAAVPVPTADTLGRLDGAPEGKVSRLVCQSKVYPGTIREYFLYVPAQYDGSKEAAVMVCQDGHTFLKPDGDFRLPLVFDNLIHKGEMPVTVAILINPGVFAEELTEAQTWKTPKNARSNRSVEYDTPDGTYARFLETEIFPEVAKHVKISSDPARRAICGNSSGGICAFTAAWERPDLFGKVVSHIGSFTNIRGGYHYPSLIRKTEKKPIRVFLQDGSGDLDNAHGNWWLSNLQMEAALKFAGWDYKTVWGDGGHSGQHGGAIFPDTLRWLWRDVR